MKRRGLELFDPLKMVTADLRPMGEGRPGGLHLSTAIRAMAKHAGLPYTGIEGEQEGYRGQMGFLMERALMNVWREFIPTQIPDIETQLQLEHDNIHMTPDGFDVGNHRLIEMKLTWKSARKWEEDPEQHFWSWLVQAKSYMWALGELSGEPVLDVLFAVGFVNGDYKGKWRLGFWTDLITFDRDELADNWRAVLNWAQFLRDGGDLEIWDPSREEER